MTFLEAIRENKMFLGISEGKITMVTLVRDINHNESYVKSSLQNLELITADLYKEILTDPQFSEGSLSITHDKAQLEAYISEVANKYSDSKLLEKYQANKPMEDKTDLW